MIGRVERVEGGLAGTSVVLRSEYGDDFFDTKLTTDGRVWVQVVWEDFPEPKTGWGERLLFCDDDEQMRHLMGKTERLEATLLFANKQRYVWKSRPISLASAGEWSPNGEPPLVPRRWFPKFPEEELGNQVSREAYLFFLAIMEDPRRHLSELWNEDLRVPA